MAPSTQFTDYASVGTAVQTRTGGKSASIAGPHGPLQFTLPEPQRIPFEPQSFDSDAKVSLCVELDADTKAWVETIEQQLRDKCAATLNLDPKDFSPFVKNNERFGSTLLRVKWIRSGHHATNFWTPDRQLIEPPSELAQRYARIQVTIGQCWMQNRQWGITLFASNVELAEGGGPPACPF